MIDDPVRADDALLAACRFVQEHQLTSEELGARWKALEQAWRGHIHHHEQYTQSRLLRRDPLAARRVRDAHSSLTLRFQRCSIDLELGCGGAEMAAKIMLDKVIEHLCSDEGCRFAAPKRTRSSGREEHDE